MKQLFAFSAMLIVLASCSQGYEKTKSGLAYKIIKGNSKTRFKQGDIIKFDVMVKISPKDTVWFSSYNRLPQYIPFDTSTADTHDFTEVLKLASVGDSIVTVAQLDTLVKKGVAQYNELFKRGDQLITMVKLRQVFTSEAEVTADQQKEFEKMKVAEVAQLEQKLKKKGIQAQKTQNGVFVVMKTPGQGLLVADGKQVTVDYTGYLVDNGKPFDSNVDSTIGRIQPFSFVVGRDPIIPGWAEGLKLFAEGGSGTMYIPSMQAYGMRGSPPVIMPFSDLQFDVTVKKVADAPPVEQPKPMPGQDPNDPRAAVQKR